MDAARRTVRRHTALAPQRRLMARAVYEWCWNLDRRRHVTQMGRSGRPHPLDEAFVGAAMARQLEEIRSLPEAAH